MKSVLLIIALTIGLREFSNSYSIPAATHIVRIEGMRFIPEIIDIHAGETIRWVNASDGAHNVVSKNKTFKSSMFSKKGDVFEYTFKEDGIFEYYCQPHRSMGMKGKVIVKE